MEITMNELREKDLTILERVRKCRAADLCDGMDALGLIDHGTMSHRMRPIRPGITFAGFAYTVQLQKTKSNVKICKDINEYYEELGKWCDRTYAFFSPITEGQLKDFVVVIDMDKYPGGIWGSENGMAAMKNGVAGVVINGACRDTYECNLEEVPAFCTTRTFNHVYGRLDLSGVNVPITCDGVGVNPMDLVFADDDGVLVMPYDRIEEILAFAEVIQDDDRVKRAKHYKDLGYTPDDTLGSSKF